MATISKLLNLSRLTPLLQSELEQRLQWASSNHFNSKTPTKEQEAFNLAFNPWWAVHLSSSNNLCNTNPSSRWITKDLGTSAWEELLLQSSHSHQALGSDHSKPVTHRPNHHKTTHSALSRQLPNKTTTTSVHSNRLLNSPNKTCMEVLWT